MSNIRGPETRNPAGNLPLKVDETSEHADAVARGRDAKHSRDFSQRARDTVREATKRHE